MPFTRFNQLSEPQARALLLDCCHCESWADALVKKRPFSSLSEIQECGAQLFLELGAGCWEEAFRGHPRIGDVSSLRERYSSTRSVAENEQGGMQGASEDTIQKLARLNAEYENKFGFIFIVFATGKTAEQMLAILETRVRNSREEELRNAAAEQNKITKLRMEKLL